MKTGLHLYKDGTKCWYLNGHRHREDGPAYVDPVENKAWWYDGRLHREDGPAVEWADGSKQWFLNGKELTESEWLDAITPMLLDRI